MEKYVGGTYGEVRRWNVWRSMWVECMEKYMIGLEAGKNGRSDVIIILKKKNIKRCINLNHPILGKIIKEN